MTAPAPRNHPAEDAHSAPTPAPAAAPEGGWLTDAEWRDFQSIPEQGYSHRSWVNARITERVADEREKVASLLLSSAGASVEEAASWAMTGRRHAARIVRTGDVDPNGVATSRPEPVVAPLPSEAVEALAKVLAAAEWPDLTWEHIVQWSIPERYRSRVRAVLAAGYRLVPEDDEDTVRVPLPDRCPMAVPGCDGRCRS